MMPLHTRQTISIDVTYRDVLMFRADVLALKHAGSLYGADQAVVAALEADGIRVMDALPPAGQSHMVHSDGAVPYDSVIFIGTPGLARFDYAAIRGFSRRVLAVLAVEAPRTRHLALTLHGTGVGLSEAEAFRSEVEGLLEAVSAGEHPESLERITVVEQSPARARRLTELLSSLSLQQYRKL